MAILYYPKNQIIARRDGSNPSVEQLILSMAPNMVFYFDTGSNANIASASFLFITASWAQTASVSTVLTLTAVTSASFASQSLSSSYSSTASFAQNAGVSGPTFAYVTVVTSSTNWITCSFLDGNEVITLPRTASYNFTQSNMPSIGFASDLVMVIYHTPITSGTSSLSFPSSWVNVGAGWPASITSSKTAILSLRAIDTSSVIGSFTVQL
jgi:hypothetical protein